MKALFKLIVIIGAITLSASQSYAEDQYRKLPSGKSIKVLEAGPVYSTTAHKTLGTMLKYQTNISLDDKTSLHKEVLEVFDDFKNALSQDPKNADVKDIFINANAPAEGSVITHNQAYTFGFEKNAEGVWQEITKN